MPGGRWFQRRERRDRRGRIGGRQDEGMVQGPKSQASSLPSSTLDPPSSRRAGTMMFQAFGLTSSPRARQAARPGGPQPEASSLLLKGVAGPKGSFEGTGTPKGSNVKQGPFDSPGAPGSLRTRAGNRKTESRLCPPNSHGYPVPGIPNSASHTTLWSGEEGGVGRKFFPPARSIP